MAYKKEYYKIWSERNKEKLKKSRREYRKKVKSRDPDYFNRKAREYRLKHLKRAQYVSDRAEYRRLKKSNPDKFYDLIKKYKRRLKILKEVQGERIQI